MTAHSRDRLGRPVAVGSADAFPEIDQHERLDDASAWSEAVGYLAGGLPFHAHEVFELRWRSAPPETRQAWKALAQWGAALTHAARGNPTGAAAVAGRALATLDAAPSVPACVDEVRVRASCHQLTAAG